MIATFSDDEITEMTKYHEGVCLECGEVIENVEPNAGNCECPDCGTISLVGIEKALILGKIGVTE